MRGTGSSARREPAAGLWKHWLRVLLCWGDTLNPVLLKARALHPAPSLSVLSPPQSSFSGSGDALSGLGQEGSQVALPGEAACSRPTLDRLQQLGTGKLRAIA